MNKSYYAVITALALLTTFAVKADTDPFAKGSWFRDTSEMDTTYYSVAPPFCSDCHYSLYYTYPQGGYARTDLCSKTSGTTLYCGPLNATVSYDAAAHSATLTRDGEKTVFYEKGYQPSGSILSGTWNAKQSKGNTLRDPHWCVFNVAVVPYAEKNTTTFYPVKKYSDGGYDLDATFKLIKDSNNMLALDTGDACEANGTYDCYFYLYDANGKRITDMNALDTLAQLRMDNIEGYGYSCTAVKAQSITRIK
jgi:hypothetical protein